MDNHVRRMSDWLDPLGAVEEGISSASFIQENVGHRDGRMIIRSLLSPIFQLLSFKALKPFHQTDRSVDFQVENKDGLPPMLLRLSLAGPNLMQTQKKGIYSDPEAFRLRRIWSPFMLQPYRRYEMQGKLELITLEVLPAFEKQREDPNNMPVVNEFFLKNTAQRQLDIRTSPPKTTRALGPVIHTEPDQLHYTSIDDARRFWDTQFEPRWQRMLLTRVDYNYNIARTPHDNRLVVATLSGDLTTLQEQRFPNPYAQRPGHSSKPIFLGRVCEN